MLDEFNKARNFMRHGCLHATHSYGKCDNAP